MVLQDSPLPFTAVVPNMENSVRSLDIKRIRSESATSFCDKDSRSHHCNRSESANQLSFNLKSEPIVTCEAVPDDLRLGSERYGFEVQQGDRRWVSPVQLRPLETWRLGFWLEEQGHEVELDRLSAVLETMIGGGAL